MKKDQKRLVIKTNVRAGCGEEAPPPSDTGDNGGGRTQVRTTPTLRLPFFRR